MKMEPAMMVFFKLENHSRMIVLLLSWQIGIDIAGLTSALSSSEYWDSSDALHVAYQRRKVLVLYAKSEEHFSYKIHRFSWKILVFF